MTGDDDVPATSRLTVTYLPRPRARRRSPQEGRGLVHAVATFALLHR